MRVIGFTERSFKETLVVNVDGAPFDLNAAGVTKLEVIANGTSKNSVDHAAAVSFSGAEMTIDFGYFADRDVTVSDGALKVYSTVYPNGKTIVGKGLEETLTVQVIHRPLDNGTSPFPVGIPNFDGVLSLAVDEKDVADDVDYFAQNSDMAFTVTVLTKNKLIVDPSEFSGAQYIITRKSGDVAVSKSLGDGISVEGKTFKVQVDDPELTTAGNFVHQFVVYDADGDKMPPVFIRDLHIYKTYSNGS